MILPVGHYLGPFHPGPGEPVEGHRVRIGTEVAALVTETEFVVWGLAHRRPGPGQAWTRETLTAAATSLGATDADDAVGSLLTIGVLVDATDPEEFARAYRLQPLLTGLGAGPGRPDLYHIGLFGTPPVAAVDALTFDVWQWAPRVDSLWALFEMQSDTAHLLGDDVNGVSGLLDRVLTLVTGNCAYLDAAATST